MVTIFGGRFMTRALRASIVLLLVAAPLNLQSQTRVFGLDDLFQVVRINDPQISRDGRTIAVVIARPDLEVNRWDSEIALVDVGSGALRQVTRGRRNVGYPRWSPDGQSLAFIARSSEAKDSHTQIFSMSTRGGDPEPLTNSPTDVQQFAWSPDGKTIAFAAADEPPKKTGLDKFNDSFEIGNDDFLVTEKPTSTHVWLVPSTGGGARRLTSGDWSLPVALPPGPPSSPLTWSPDGRTLAIVRGDTPHDADYFRTRVALLDVATGEMRQLTSASQLESFPSFSPDGSQIAYWYNRDGDINSQNEVSVAPVRGGARRDVTRSLDRNLFRVHWMADGKSLLVAGNDARQTSMWIQPLDGTAERVPVGTLSLQSSFWVDIDTSPRGAIAFVASEPHRPAELYYMESSRSAPRRLTTLNDTVASFDLGRVEGIEWQSDGLTHNGILTYPPNFDATKKYPLVLIIHGGPAAASLHSFSSQAQLFAARGWVVFQPNYRGSDHTGSAYFHAIVGDPGEGPGRDVMAGLAAVKKRGFVDDSRIGVTGWSYGGFMTTWLIGHYQGWRAAMAGAPVTDFIDQAVLADGGWAEFMGGGPFAGNRLAAYRAHSPITSASNIKTPTLIMSNTGDFRVPITQAFKLFSALKDNNVETSFVAYPTPGHNPNDPVRQRDVQKRWMEWLERHFK